MSLHSTFKNLSVARNRGRNSIFPAGRRLAKLTGKGKANHACGYPNPDSLNELLWSVGLVVAMGRGSWGGTAARTRTSSVVGTYKLYPKPKKNIFPKSGCHAQAGPRGWDATPTGSPTPCVAVTEVRPRCEPYRWVVPPLATTGKRTSTCSHGAYSKA